jgi:hypothetical protein
MGRYCDTGRDMEAICLAQIASIVWRFARLPVSIRSWSGGHHLRLFGNRDQHMLTAASCEATKAEFTSGLVMASNPIWPQIPVARR